MDIGKRLQQAITHHQAGQLDDAEQCYLKILQIAPDHPDSNHNFGLLKMQQGQTDDALTLFNTALNTRPNAISYWVSYIDALIYTEQFDVAEKLLKLGRSNGLAGEAFDQLETILEAQLKENKLAPLQAQLDSINALDSKGQVEKILKYLDVLIKSHPDLSILHYISGDCYKDLGQFKTAVTSYQRALQIEPNYAEVHHNLASVLRELNERDAAVKHYKKALRNKQDFVEAYNNLGVTFQELGQQDAAVKSYEKALIIKPDYAEAYFNLGNSLMSIGQLCVAAENFEKALIIEPNYTEAHNNLGLTLKDLGQTDVAIKCYEQARAIKPDYLEAHNNRLFTLNYSTNHDPAFCLKEARKFGVLCSKKVVDRFPDFQCSLTPKRLKIGLVSGDFSMHPVGYFLESLLSALTQQNLELIAYTTQPKFDDLSARIKPLFSEWKVLFGLTDEGAAQLIHDDGIHILIDLSGHTAYNRLPVFAFKPAPVQVSWLGYFATTGLVEIDYVIGDPYVTPVQVEDQFSEKIFRLPHTRWCFTAPRVTIKTATLPALKNGYITFGCFNNLAKLNDQVIELWIKILRAIPNACLLLKSKQLNSLSVQEMVTTKFTAHGIEPERIILAGDSSYEEYLSAYQRVDIALDPFPFTGGTVTLEGLWMGVPVLTLQGNTLVSNQGVSILMNAGLAHWIAHDEDDYLAKAINFSSNLKQLTSIRSGLREQVLASPLFDAKQFSVDFKNALWTMWQQWLTDNNFM